MVGFKHGRLEKKSLFVISMIILIAAFGLNQLGICEAVNHYLGDLYAKKFAQKPKNYNNKISYIVIKQSSIDRFEESQNIGWPWPREVYSYIIDFLLLGQAKTITFDFIFSETSIFGIADDSAFFGKLSENSHKVVTGLLFSKSGPPASLDNIKGKSLGKDFRDSYFSRYQTYLPFPETARGFNLNFGNISYSEDSDGINRRINPLISFKNYLFPFLTLPAALIEENEEIMIEQNSIHVGQKTIPLTNNGETLLKYYSSFYDYSHFDIIDIMESFGAIQNDQDTLYDSFVSPTEFKDKHVLIGSDAPGLKDLRPNPLSNRDPGVHIYGTFLDNFINDDFLIYWGNPLLNFIIVFLLGFLGSTIANLPGMFKSGAIFSLFLVMISSLTIVLFAFFNIVINYGLFFFSYVFAFIMVSSFLFYENKHQKHILQSAFSQLISPVVMDEILSSPEAIHLGGEMKKMTIFFSDIQGFTEISEKISPQALIEVLNIYLNEISHIIIDEHRGYIDKYIGDAVMAVWGVPLDQDDQADLACKAAVECVRSIDKINRVLKAKGYSLHINFRIGLNTGDAVVGMMGSDRKKNYTVLGDAVNLSSRLEGINKYYGTNIMMSQSTLQALTVAPLFRKIDNVRVKGKNEAISIYQVLTGNEGLTDEELSLFNESFENYEKGEFIMANKGFSQLKLKDKASMVFYERCEHMMEQPPKRWDGVYTFKVK